MNKINIKNEISLFLQVLIFYALWIAFKVFILKTEFDLTSFLSTFFCIYLGAFIGNKFFRKNKK